MGPLFLVVEGMDGAGKSTQIERLANWLRSIGADPLVTHEPGATAIGAGIRAILLDPAHASMDARTEALLYAADRAQHAAEVLRSALAGGRDVVTDRFTGSSLAYQGFGRGLDVGELRRLSAWATDGIEADLVILLDVPPDVARSRQTTAPDRLEAEEAGFHERVVEGFRALAAGEPERWAVVDGTGSVEEVAARVRKVLEAFST